MITHSPLSILTEQEMMILIEDLAHQLLKNLPSVDIRSLLPPLQQALVHERPASLHALIYTLQHTLIKKSTHAIHGSVIAAPPLTLSPAFGKKCLTDATMMHILWHAFNKNQNHIAHFLQVNRSTISRRVKFYQLS